jgi:hypothetical protein
MRISSPARFVILARVNDAEADGYRHMTVAVSEYKSLLLDHGDLQHRVETLESLLAARQPQPLAPSGA